MNLECLHLGPKKVDFYVVTLRFKLALSGKNSLNLNTNSIIPQPFFPSHFEGNWKILENLDINFTYFRVTLKNSKHQIKSKSYFTKCPKL